MDVVILCDGRAPSEEMIRKAVENAGLFIAADGGGNQALKLGLHPDFITGDLDSFSMPDQYRGRIIRNVDQETNDLEKALDLAIEQSGDNIDSIQVFGAAGKRLDHTLKNLSVLKKYDGGKHRIRFLDSYGEMILLPKVYRERFPEGTALSLFPLSGRVEGITTRGLKYPLNHEFLENGVRDGTSNQSVEEVIEITHKKGDLLLFIATNRLGH